MLPRAAFYLNQTLLFRTLDYYLNQAAHILLITAVNITTFLDKSKSDVHLILAGILNCDILDNGSFKEFYYTPVMLIVIMPRSILIDYYWRDFIPTIINIIVVNFT